MGLIKTLRVEDKIILNQGDIVITLIKIRGKQVQLHISAPKEISIDYMDHRKVIQNDKR